MFVKLRTENLSKEYIKKLQQRSLSRQAVDSLAAEISKKCVLHKRAFRRAMIITAAATALLMLLTALSPKALDASPAALTVSFVLLVILEAFIFIFVYFAAVTKIPRQFDRALKAGYPELVEIYGYEVIMSGELSEIRKSRQLPFSMMIEEIFELKDSNNVVVCGFVHGFIARGNSVFIGEIAQENPLFNGENALAPKGQPTAIVSAIENNGGKPSKQAAECFVALEIHGVKDFTLRKGMYLYRDTPAYFTI